MLGSMMFPAGGATSKILQSRVDGKFNVVEQLPWGELSTFYIAEDAGEPVTLQFLSMDVGDSRSARTAFQELTSALYRSEGESLVPLRSHGIADGVPYMVYDAIDAIPLDELLFRGSFESADALSVARDVLDALVALNDNGVIHADITPNNVIVHRHRHSCTLRAFLLGSGVASLMRNHPGDGANTRTGSGQHSVAYMAPELFGGRPFQHQTDLYSVGILLHHMVIGNAPVGWETAEGYEDIPDLPPIVVRAMEHRPEDSFAHARAMLAALEWIDVESAKRNPATQDIAPWMATSAVDSIPVPSIASTVPPAYAPHQPGTILRSSTPENSGMHALGTFEAAINSVSPLDGPPTIVVDGKILKRERLWLQIALLLTILLGLIGLILTFENTKKTLGDATGNSHSVTIGAATRIEI